MGNINISACVVCPYYITSSDSRGDYRITCEGIEYSKYNTIRFSNKDEKEVYMATRCSFYPNGCKIAKLVEEKYKS